MAKYKRYIIISAIIFLIVRCASQLPPGGGEIDTVPPEITEIYPASGTTNFNDDYFELSFSEYVDKRSVQEAVFISPKIEGEIEYSWTGKTLTINFKRDSLKANTTYSVTIGTDVKDLNNSNRMANAYNFAFSTGEEIDKGVITGVVHYKDPSGILIFAYLISGKDIDPSIQKPDYLSQIGEDGRFTLLGLKHGKYLIYAVRDDFRDLLYNMEQDFYGAPSNIISLSEKDTLYENLNFMLTKEDTTKPSLSNATMTDANHLLLEFNENIDSTKISGESFFIFDSTQNRKIPILYVFKGKTKDRQIFASFSDTLSTSSDNYLISQNIPDLFGNISNLETTQIVVSTKIDTLFPSIARVETGLEERASFYDNSKLIFLFDDGFPMDALKEGISFMDKKENSIPFEFSKIDDASFSLETKKLKPSTDYSIQINLKLIKDAAGNAVDSIYTYAFKTVSDLYFSGIYGKIFSADSASKKYFVLENTETKEIKYSGKADLQNNYELHQVIPGKYILWAFNDNDNNGKYSHGKIKPFQPSEKFAFYPDTLQFKARWPLEDVFIEIR
ncbi:MAG: Ig-like domain-containing protein [bacterium]